MSSIHEEGRFKTPFGIMEYAVTSATRACLSTLSGGCILYRDRRWTFNGHMVLEDGAWQWVTDPNSGRVSIEELGGKNRRDPSAPPTFRAKMMDDIKEAFNDHIETFNPDISHRAEIKDLDRQIERAVAKVAALQQEIEGEAEKLIELKAKRIGLIPDAP